MEFWGIEVKAGQSIKTDPGDNHVIHLSQASLGESKNKADPVRLYVNVDGKKLVFGTLSRQNCPQFNFDLIFEQDFELSHNCKNGSVYFIGYKMFIPKEGGVGFDSEEENDDEELPMVAAENGKAKTDAKMAKANAMKHDAARKKAVKIAEPSNNKKYDDDDSDDYSDSDFDDLEHEAELCIYESSDDEDESESEETLKKVELSKKRPAEAAVPISAKKPKSSATPQKTEGKKGGHSATPHPSKQAGKSSGKSPKFGGEFSCGSCSKSFGSVGGLESHKKAKHGGK